MAGHSKWANIKHRKGRQDAKRGRVFSVLVKKISSAARRGGGDPNMNAELRLMIEKAKAANLPADNIERAILKATGQLEGTTYEEVSYEGYGPGGAAVWLEGATDSRNRIVAEIRFAFSKAGGALGENGSVAWMFETLGVIAFPAEQVENINALMEIALDNGADDVEEGEVITVTCQPDAYPALSEALSKGGFGEPLSDEIAKVAQNMVELSGDDAEAAMRMLDTFEEMDDVESVHSNIEFDSDWLDEQS